ncbi:MAG: cytochrome c [Bacteroidetes bacterium]|nr:cytochrome c [Bacteroidota bacterium]
MNRKHLFSALIAISIFIFSCGGNSSQAPAGSTPAPAPEAAKPANDTKGVGKFTNVELTHPLDEGMVKQGQAIYELKCASCHKLSTEKLVGPGWKGVTDRRAPEWIMNFATNTDEMLDKDANAKALLEVCMVRMPNQNLKDDEVRHVLEFMRKNDGKN